MAVGDETVKDPPETGTPPAEGGTGTPPKKPVVPPAPTTKVEGVPPASGGADPDGDDPNGVYEKDGKKFVKMPYEAFKARITKATKKSLKEIFGTSDQKAILEIKKRFDEFSKDAEDRKKAEMTERQRLETEKKELESARDTATRRANRLKDRLVVQKTAQVVTRAARAHVRPDKQDMAIDLFRAALLGMNRKQADKMVKKEGEWFAEFVAKNPDFAKGESSEKPEKTERTEKKPVSNGIDPKKTREKPSAAASAAGTKDVKNMTKAELAAYAKERGLSLPSIFG